MPGSTTPRVSEITTDASIGLPPARSVSSPAWVARGWFEPTAPLRPMINTRWLRVGIYIGELQRVVALWDQRRRCRFCCGRRLGWVTRPRQLFLARTRPDTRSRKGRGGLCGWRYSITDAW